MDIIPQGLRFLQGLPHNETDTIKALDECCEEHNGDCPCVRECQKLYATRCGTNPRDGGWKWGYRNTYRLLINRYESDVQRYANTLPQLSLHNALRKIRENMLGGLQ